MSTPYNVLGVGKSASKAEIKRAYRKKSRTAHPDRAGGSDAAQSALNRAYALLSDDTKRAHYDATGSEQVTPLEQAANGNLAKLTQQLLEAYVTQGEFNLVARAREVITNTQANLKNSATTQRRKIDAIERLLKKHLRPNNKAHPHLLLLIEHQLQQEKLKLAEHERGQEVGTAMLKMLEGYGWEEDRKAGASWTTETVFIFTGGTGS